MANVANHICALYHGDGDGDESSAFLGGRWKVNTKRMENIALKRDKKIESQCLLLLNIECVLARERGGREEGGG